MGSTNKTTNYELSQFLGSDKPAWLLDYNGDMLKIDTQMKANADAASAAQSKADTADGKADDLRTDLTTLNNQVNDPTGLAADVATLAGTMNTVTSLIGNGEPTTTDKTLIGAINELDSDINGVGGTEEKIGDLSTLTTTNKSSVVAAINELDAFKTQISSSRKVQVTADGTKTYSQLLDELYAAFMNDIGLHTVILSGLNIPGHGTGHSLGFLTCDTETSIIACSSTSFIDSNNFRFGKMYCRSSGSSIEEFVISTSGTISYSDISSTVPTSGANLTIAYIPIN